MVAITEHEQAQIDRGERVGQDARRLRPRTVAAAEQLGSLADAVRGRGLLDPRPGLA